MASKSQVNRFNKNGSMKGGVLNINVAVQNRYRRKLQFLVRKMTTQLNSEIKSFLNKPIAKEQFINDAGIMFEVDQITNKLNARFKNMFDDVAKSLAEDMAEDTDKVSKSRVTSSLKIASESLNLTPIQKGSGLDKLTKIIVNENVDLIKSIPREYMGKVRERLKESFVSGKDTSDALQKVVDAGEITKRRADIIAMDQTRKAYNGMNTVRMKLVGVEKAIWIHSGASVHPRESHILLNNTEFDLAEGAYDEDVGEYVMPGELCGCQCTMRPIISFNEGDDATNE